MFLQVHLLVTVNNLEFIDMETELVKIQEEQVKDVKQKIYLPLNRTDDLNEWYVINSGSHTLEAAQKTVMAWKKTMPDATYKIISFEIEL